MLFSFRDACDARNGWSKWGPGNGMQACFAARKINCGIFRAVPVPVPYSSTVPYCNKTDPAHVLVLEYRSVVGCIRYDMK